MEESDRKDSRLAERKKISPERQRQLEISQRLARLAWFDCADGATRRALAADGVRRKAPAPSDPDAE
ncbi:hypothetical protein [Niveispirillum irakense]|uniref:hypothetical protein n=1 Tax=Niveispirillum irakense TaxID=34011 RepID=UPI0003FAAAFC|nr:hypothetical protein [Niveispirillum irakense]